MALLCTGYAHAQGVQPFAGGLDSYFTTETGDPYSAILLNQLFGPLFPAPGKPQTPTIMSGIAGAINVLILFAGAILFFYNVVAGTLQTAHEGVVLGRRWSSLWAPLRVLFAAALLFPVPGMGGYNTVQTGIAWLVKGSTVIASEVWILSARKILQGELPITGTGRPFDGEVFKTVYRNQLCRKIADFQFEMAESDHRVSFARVRTGETVELVSRIGEGQDGICGSYQLPEPPVRITSEGLTQSQAIVSEFRTLHENILAGLVTSANAILELQWPVVLENKGDLPETSGLVSMAIDQASRQLEAGNASLLARVKGESGDQGQARQIIEEFITGGNCHQDHTESGACTGNGWIGAGNWYMTIARLNSEVMGLMNATIAASDSTYLAENVNRLNRTVVSEADGVGWLRRAFRPVDSGKYLHLDETTRIWTALVKDMEHTTAGLSALGFAIPASILDQAAPETSSGLLARIWRTSFVGSVGSLIENLSPSNWGDDPVVGIVNMGNWYLDIAGTLIFGGAAVSFLSGSISTTITFLIAAPLAAIGLTQSFVLPLLPFFIWILAVARYFLIVVEAVIGSSLWALSHLRLDGEGISGEAGRLGWVSLLALLLTPPLMVAGFIIGMIMFRILAGLLDIGMFYAMSALVNASPIIGIFGLIATGFLLVFAYIAVIERSFSLVSEFPDRVLRWIGGQADLSPGDIGQFKVGTGFLAAGLQGGIRQLKGPVNAGAAMLGRKS